MTEASMRLVQSLDQHLCLQRAQLAGLNDDRTAGRDGRRQLEANKQSVRVPCRNQTGYADRFQGNRRLVPAARQRQLLECFLRCQKRKDRRIGCEVIARKSSTSVARAIIAIRKSEYDTFIS